MEVTWFYFPTREMTTENLRYDYPTLRCPSYIDAFHSLSLITHHI